MKKIILPVSIALAQMLAVSAFAQTGQADTTPSKMPVPATAAQKAAGKAERKVEGTQATKEDSARQDDLGHPSAKKPKVSKAARKAARAKRKAAATAAVKNGEINTGEGATAK